MNLPDFKMDFADRVQKYLFNGGLLTPAVFTNRYSQLASVRAAGHHSLNPRAGATTTSIRRSP